MLRREVSSMLADCELVGIVPTADPARAKAFYCGVLGLEFVQDDGFAQELRVHHATLRLVKMPEVKPSGGTLLGWAVTEIAASVKELVQAGVVFERYGFFEQDELGVWTAPNGAKVAWFKDRDGNTLSLSQGPS
jgi:catechol 2,3-dioxygenase-like lactoylglutathione lyase family enzyme